MSKLLSTEVTLTITKAVWFVLVSSKFFTLLVITHFINTYFGTIEVHVYIFTDSHSQFSNPNIATRSLAHSLVFRSRPQVYYHGYVIQDSVL